MSIRRKLSIGLACLTGVLLGVCALSLVQVYTIQDELDNVLEVDEPANASAYEIEINLLESQLDVLAYLRDRDRMHLDLLQDNTEDLGATCCIMVWM